MDGHERMIEKQNKYPWKAKTGKIGLALSKLLGVHP